MSEAEEWISELEDKMVEITSEKQSKKNEKSGGQSPRTLGQYQTQQHLNYRGVLEEEEKWENFWRQSWKFPQHGKGNSQSSPEGTESHTG